MLACLVWGFCYVLFRILGFWVFLFGYFAILCLGFRVVACVFMDFAIWCLGFRVVACLFEGCCYFVFRFQGLGLSCLGISLCCISVLVFLACILGGLS